MKPDQSVAAEIAVSLQEVGEYISSMKAGSSEVTNTTGPKTGTIWTALRKLFSVTHVHSFGYLTLITRNSSH